jgi:GAF domain-containing protein
MDFAFTLKCRCVVLTVSPIGSVCILDRKPREFSQEEKDRLQHIADGVMDEIKQRRVQTGRNALKASYRL